MSKKCIACGQDEMEYCDCPQEEERECLQCGDICDARNEICGRCDMANGENYQESVNDSYMVAIRGY